ncbi:MAG: CsbD family protein [Caulobacterales bacterium]|nr:CsbD family protein [Caulobacterales bacterium]MCA0373742.1 CsbD family protein [Pseudomonadota bacterium]
MDKNIIYGKAKVVRGAITKSVGKVIGSEKMQIDGAKDQFVGAAQSAMGKVKDIITDKDNNPDRSEADKKIENKKNEKFFQTLSEMKEEDS